MKPWNPSPKRLALILPLALALYMIPTWRLVEWARTVWDVNVAVVEHVLDN